MSRPSRRLFLAQLGALGLAGASPGCRRAVTRDAALRAVVTDVAAPFAASLETESTVLATAVAALGPAPHLPALDAARAAWRRAAIAWRSAQCFRSGPLVETSALVRCAFWPPRLASLAELVSGARALDAALVDELGVDQKGLFALEAFLFGGVAPSFAASRGERLATLSRLFAADVATSARRIHASMGAGKEYSATFAAAGQESLNRLVNQMIETVEATAVERLGRVLELAASGRERPGEIEGGPSSTSRDLALALLTGTERLYTGAGGPSLEKLVATTAPELAARIGAAFRAATAQVVALDGPLEAVAAKDPKRLARAREATKELERALRTDLASTLGVTLTFLSGDGD